MSDICNNIISAIDILTEQKLAEAGYDRTIDAMILGCVYTAGNEYKYKLQYQNSTIYALGSENYKEGTRVLVTIPQNDNSKPKRIIGVAEPSITTSTLISDLYEKVGANSVKSDAEFRITPNNDFDIYNKTKKINIGFLDQEIIKNSIRSSNSLIVSAAFKTALTAEQIEEAKGDYGLRFNLIFIDPETKKEIPKPYELDINYIEGLPYELYNYTYTTATFEDIDGLNFDRVESIEFYAKNFTKEEGEIFVKDLFSVGAQKIDKVDQSGVIVQVSAPKGYFFNTIEEELTLLAQVRKNGEIVSVASDDVDVYWFRENPLVNSRHDKYSRYGGEGWMCLNQREPLYDDETGVVKVDDNGNIIYSKVWIPASIEYKVKGKDILSKSGNFKCVVNLGGKEDSSELVTLYHTTNDLPSFAIQSIEEDNIAKLTCVGKNLIDGVNYTYHWTKTKSNGSIIQLAENTNALSVNLLLIDGNEEYSCVVYSDGLLVANPKIILSAGEKTDPTYKVVIKNGERMFLYNEDGSAKAYDIPALEVVLYDPQGKVVAQDQYTVTWETPTNSLIRTNFAIDKEDEINSNSLKYTIASRYQQSLKYSEQIKAIVNYGDVRAEGYTDIMFAREGELGTNGTGTYCIIKPNTSKEIIDFYPTYTWIKEDDDSVSGSWNGDIEATEPFKVELWTGMDIANDSISPSWSILKSALRSVSSSFTSTGVVTNAQQYPTRTATYVNLLKAEVEDNNETYSSVVAPICAYVKKGYSIELKHGTGFQDVLFSSDGKNAKFINRPFEVVVTTPEEEELSYEWFTHDKTGILSIKGEATLKTFTLDIKSTAKYNGKDTSTAVECIVSNNTEEEVARIYIPIHMHLNTYGNGAINGWDGNSLVLNQDTNAYLLAPQIGAGTKNSENQFTGIVMGEVQEGMDSSSKIGLFGYHNGEQSIFLDAESGNATFGTSAGGQIKITANQAIIESGNYKSNVSGMQIDLQKGTISSPNFKINSNGKLVLGKNGIIESDNYNTINGTGMQINLANGSMRTGSGSFIINNDGNASFSGAVYANEGTFGNLTITGNLNYQKEYVSDPQYYIGTGGRGTGYINLPNFSVDSAGKVSLTGANGVIEIGTSESGTKKIGTKISSEEVILKTYYSTGVETSTTLTGQDIKVGTESGGSGLGQTTYGNHTIEYKTAEDSGYFYISVYSYLASTSAPSIEFHSGKSSSACYGILGGTWKLDNDSIVTSDETKKNTINPLSDQYSILFDNLQPITYKYNDGASDRLHTGFGARATEQAILAAGLTTKDFAAVCYNLDEDGNKVDYGIRYGEIVALNTNEIQKLKARVIELENIIQELKNQ